MKALVNNDYIEITDNEIPLIVAVDAKEQAIADINSASTVDALKTAMLKFVEANSQ